MAINLYKILGVSKTATDAEIKTAYRALARQFHPDVNPGDKKAEEKFKQVTQAYEVLGDLAKRAKYDATGNAGPVMIASRRGTYQLDDVTVAGDVADIYHVGANAVKIVRTPGDNDLLENEAKILKNLFAPGANLAHRRYFPEFVESFKINNGGTRQVNVTKWIDGTMTLADIMNAYPNGVRFEHGVWMLNRMLEALDYLHGKCEIVHGAITPSHVLIHPKDHGATLVGFTAAQAFGDKIQVISPDWAHIYPPEIKQKMPASAATDIYMAVQCVKLTMSAGVPKYLSRFIDGCLFANPRSRPQDSWGLHEELKTLMEDNYGPKKFIPFEVPDVH